MDVEDHLAQRCVGWLSPKAADLIGQIARLSVGE